MDVFLTDLLFLDHFSKVYSCIEFFSGLKVSFLRKEMVKFRREFLDGSVARRLLVLTNSLLAPCRQEILSRR